MGISWAAGTWNKLPELVTESWVSVDPRESCCEESINSKAAENRGVYQLPSNKQVHVQPADKFLTLFSENWQPQTEFFEFSADILDRSVVWCHTMGLVFSLPLLYLFVCLIFCNACVPGWSYPKSCFLWWSTTAKEALRGKNLPSGMESFAKSICSVALASFCSQLFPLAFLSSNSHPTDVTDFKSALK